MNTKLKVLILKGLPACGKTTYAKKLLEKDPDAFTKVCKDEIREMLFGKRWGNTKYEHLVVTIRNKIIMESLKKGFSVIVDDTNLNPVHITRIKKLVNNEAEVEVIDFTDTPLKECIERDKNREHSVGERAIINMYNKYIKT